MFNAKTVALFLAMMVCTVVANVFMKIGATNPGGKNWLFGVAGTHMLLGIAFFGAALVFYLWILRVVPLNVAQSFTAAQFVGVILASWIVLSEPIPPLRWFGVALIASGILVVALTLERS